MAKLNNVKKTEFFIYKKIRNFNKLIMPYYSISVTFLDYSD